MAGQAKSATHDSSSMVTDVITVKVRDAVPFAKDKAAESVARAMARVIGTRAAVNRSGYYAAHYVIAAIHLNCNG